MSIFIHRPKSEPRHHHRVRVWAYVPSRSRVNLNHLVAFIRTKNDDVRRWVCDCEDFMFRQIGQRRHCNHIKDVRRELGQIA